ncbi:hypothetical protein [Pseudoruegeria sp. HB172150]|uniref:hypothetical protein n=1 Tax=Pseudoruegeria sp. HB172150 TaxID=2721164 RepID=UPI001C12DB4D|nr:hypothetical protein [Pseudoruegeria sp. HB172150]
MSKDNHLERHLALCKRIYLRLLAERKWPFPNQADSPNFEDLVESKDWNDDV